VILKKNSKQEQSLLVFVASIDPQLYHQNSLGSAQKYKYLGSLRAYFHLGEQKMASKILEGEASQQEDLRPDV